MVLTKDDLINLISDRLPDNGANQIGADDLRDVLVSVVDTMFDNLAYSHVEGFRQAMTAGNYQIYFRKEFADQDSYALVYQAKNEIGEFLSPAVTRYANYIDVTMDSDGTFNFIAAEITATNSPT